MKGDVKLGLILAVAFGLVVYPRVAVDSAGADPSETEAAQLAAAPSATPTAEPSGEPSTAGPVLPTEPAAPTAVAADSTPPADADKSPLSSIFPEGYNGPLKKSESADKAPLPRPADVSLPPIAESPSVSKPDAPATTDAKDSAVARSDGDLKAGVNTPTTLPPFGEASANQPSTAPLALLDPAEVGKKDPATDAKRAGSERGPSEDSTKSRGTDVAPLVPDSEKEKDKASEAVEGTPIPRAVPRRQRASQGDVALEGGLPPFEIRSNNVPPIQPKPSTTRAAAKPVHPFYQRYLDRKEYFVRDGDTLANIAQRLYQDEAMVRELLAANRDLITNPGDLRQGMILRLP